MLLRPVSVSTRQFTMMNLHSFVAEISDLGPSFKFGRVYDDACDEGLTLVSQWSGDEIVFAIDREIKDGEGELMGWELKPVPESHRRHLSITIFND